jgi:hypothetical protein
MLVGQVEFPPTVEADLVCATFNGEHPADVAVPAAKDGSKKGQQFHKSCAL